jgi:hypothetical protein
VLPSRPLAGSIAACRRRGVHQRVQRRPAAADHLAHQSRLAAAQRWAPLQQHPRKHRAEQRERIVPSSHGGLHRSFLDLQEETGKTRGPSCRTAAGSITTTTFRPTGFGRWQRRPAAHQRAPLRLQDERPNRVTKPLLSRYPPTGSIAAGPSTGCSTRPARSHPATRQAPLRHGSRRREDHGPGSRPAPYRRAPLREEGLATEHPRGPVVVPLLTGDSVAATECRISTARPIRSPSRSPAGSIRQTHRPVGPVRPRRPAALCGLHCDLLKLVWPLRDVAGHPTANRRGSIAASSCPRACLRKRGIPAAHRWAPLRQHPRVHQGDQQVRAVPLLTGGLHCDRGAGPGPVPG